jgi:hypothetical protein
VFFEDPPETPPVCTVSANRLPWVIAMKWKLHTRDETRSPPVAGSDQYDSKDVALRMACGIFRQQRSIAVLYIEGPNGERIESKDIAAWCKILARA